MIGEGNFQHISALGSSVFEREYTNKDIFNASIVHLLTSVKWAQLSFFAGERQAIPRVAQHEAITQS